jgi:hypothetical protein
VIGPFVDINIDFFPWPSWFFGQVLIDWNWIWNNVNVVINVNNVNCPPNVAPNKLVKPINNPTPPPAVPVVAGAVDCRSGARTDRWPMPTARAPHRSPAPAGRT